jgi:hypothetical protein
METAIIPRQSWKSLETLLTWGPIWSNLPIYLVDEKKEGTTTQVLSQEKLILVACGSPAALQKD